MGSSVVAGSVLVVGSGCRAAAGEAIYVRLPESWAPVGSQVAGRVPQVGAAVRASLTSG